MRMKPIFVVLSSAAMAMMVYTFLLGWNYHHGAERLERRTAAGAVITEAEREAVGRLIPRHFVWGMLTGIGVGLVHSIVLTYFIGTGKAIREQMDLRGWTSEDHDRWKRHMAQAVVPSSSGIVLIILAAFSGGFTMIGSISPSVHLGIAAFGILGQIPILARLFVVIDRNGKLMDEIVERLDQDGIALAL